MSPRPIPLPQLHREITQALKSLRDARMDGGVASISIAVRRLNWLLDELSARLKASAAIAAAVSAGDEQEVPHVP